MARWQGRWISAKRPRPCTRAGQGSGCALTLRGVLRGPGKYKVLERRRRHAQIAARRALDLIDVAEASRQSNRGRKVAMSRCTHTHGRTLCFECFRTGIEKTRARREAWAQRALPFEAPDAAARPLTEQAARAPPSDAGVPDRHRAGRQSGVATSAPMASAGPGRSAARGAAASAGAPVATGMPGAADADKRGERMAAVAVANGAEPARGCRPGDASDRWTSRRESDRDRERQPLPHRGIGGRRLPIPRDISQILPEATPVLGAPHGAVRERRVRARSRSSAITPTTARASGISIGHGAVVVRP